MLAYCGHDIHDLARNATFEETCYLLWHGRLPNRAELGDLQSQLAAARPLPEPILRLMNMLPPSDGMDALRTLTSALGHYDPDAHDNSLPASYRKAVRLTGQIASLVATWGRMQQGGGPIAPDPAMGHAANFLYMLFGTRPNPTEIRAMDIALTLHADHELNASTFAARVAAATLTDIHSAIVAGIGTLKGPLHGGANAEVMKMLIEIGQDAPADRIDAFVKGKFARKEKISGLRPPRLQHRGPARDAPAQDVEGARPEGRQHQVVRDERAHRGAGQGREEAAIRTSISTPRPRITRWASPIDLYTPIFAVSRISGWTAHVLEQLANNRLIRPRADYTGPAYPQTWIPLEQR